VRNVSALVTLKEEGYSGVTLRTDSGYPPWIRILGLWIRIRIRPFLSGYGYGYFSGYIHGYPRIHTDIYKSDPILLVKLDQRSQIRSIS